MNKTNPMVMTAITAVIAGVVGGGIGFEVAKMPQFAGTPQAGQFGQGRGGNRFQGNGPGPSGFQQRMMGRGVIGEITSMDDKSITVKQPDGSSKIVLTSGSTTYETTATAKKEDLKTGTNVRVIGNTNTDGSV